MFEDFKDLFKNMFEDFKSISKKWWVYYSVIMLALAVWYGYKINPSVEEAWQARETSYFSQHLAELNSLYNELNPLPGATYTFSHQYTFSSRQKHGRRCFISYYCSTNLSIQEVLIIYDLELKEKGWLFKEVKKSSHPFEGESVIYEKKYKSPKIEEYTTRIQYKNGELENPTTFIIHIEYDTQY